MAYFKNEVPAEAKLEADLIEQLTTGVSQWTYCPGINTEEKLWANLKKILEANNPEAIDGEPLTEHEMSQIKDQLNFNSTFDAAEWMMGDNGIAHLEVDRDDVSRGKIYLAAFKRDKILGDSTYQVINQYVLPKDSEGPRGRRFDVSLLINGIPMIHIELKSQNHPYMDAYRQIKKYTKEGQFQGPFSALQMFVVSNGT
ncbi:MAG: type I restriction endonuclease subunit R, partial [Lacticaseibacillus paracasei]|nr:type I restriction endonuclease subunit R [Lacticaseibacillus paracasei]